MSPSPDHCCKVVPLLRKRERQETTVILSAGRTLSVFDIAWGTDLGDDFEHITTNVSPGIKGGPIDLFFTDEVVSIIDPKTGHPLWQTDGEASVR